MDKILLATLWRAIRGSVSLFIANWLANAQGNQNLVWLTPALLALGKGIRDKWPGKATDWLPI